MRRWAVLSAVVSAVAGVATPARGQEQPLERRAADVAALFRADPGGYDQVFAPSFLAQIPAARLDGIFGQYVASYGKVTGRRLTESPQPGRGKFEFTFEKGYAAMVDVVVAPDAPHLVTGLWIGPASRLAASLDEIVAELGGLPGEASLLALRHDRTGPVPLAQLHPDRALALGSAFKLYVLAELVRQVRTGTRRWDEIVSLDAAARSWPSGMLHDWPAGAPVTLHTLAALMISISDNTATDQLIRTLGRERVEAVQRVTGHASPELNVPFLTTLELFQLKSDSALAARYLAADAAGRRQLLAGRVAVRSRDSVRALGGRPATIDRLEWFASAADLSRLLVWLRDQTETGPAASARAILAVNPGLAVPKARFGYVGFKGGSEPGVLNLSFLLRSQDGRWYTLVATWNNRNAALDEPRFLGLVQRAINLLD